MTTVFRVPAFRGYVVMPYQPFFSELLDTRWTQPEHRQAAQALLMLRTLAPAPCELSVTHAISSPTILDDCATDDYFLLLVEKGAIRFRQRPRGKHIFGTGGALRALIEGFHIPGYRLDNWPGFKPSLTLTERSEIAVAATNVLEGRTASTGSDNIDLDQRLLRAKRLCDAIDRAPATALEGVRGPDFTQRAMHAHKRLQEDEHDTAAFFGRVVEELLLRQPEPASLDRSLLYSAIEAHETATDGRVIRAKDVVDAIYNESMALSLGQSLLSVRDPTMTVFSPSLDAEKIKIDVLANFSSTDSGLQLVPLGWRTVWDLLNRRDNRDHDGPTDSSARISAQDILSAVTDRQPTYQLGEVEVFKSLAVIPFALAGTALGVSTWIDVSPTVAVPLIGGGIGLTILGALAAGRAHTIADDRRRSRTEARVKAALEGWLGKIGYPLS